MRCADRLAQLQLLHHGLAHACDRRQAGRGGGDDAVQVAERVEQQPREGLHVLPGDGAEQEQLQQFIVWHRGCTAVHEAAAQTFAVVLDVGGQAVGKRAALSLVII